MVWQCRKQCPCINNALNIPKGSMRWQIKGCLTDKIYTAHTRCKREESDRSSYLYTLVWASYSKKWHLNMALNGWGASSWGQLSNVTTCLNFLHLPSESTTQTELTCGMLQPLSPDLIAHLSFGVTLWYPTANKARVFLFCSDNMHCWWIKITKSWNKQED